MNQISDTGEQMNIPIKIEGPDEINAKVEKMSALMDEIISMVPAADG